MPRGRDEAASRGVDPGGRLRFRVLDAGSRADVTAWLEAWRRWPEREVMAHPEYARLFARPDERVVAVLAEAEGGAVLFPLVLRPIAAEPWAAPGEDRWDATTPYGYGGPFAWGEREGHGPAFWQAYEAWCRDERVVCTFARLSLFPDQLAPLKGKVEVRGPNVVVPLQGGIDAVWRGYDRDVRRRLRVARREGVTVELDRDGARVAEFHEIYAHTMERRRAPAWYRFPCAFFERLVRLLPGQFLLVHALAGGRVLSSELVLASARHVYAFLGGTRSDGFHVYPNEVVRHAAAEWAAADGKAGYVLGGGRSAEDGIYRHKRLLAPKGEVPFRTACLVHDELAYHALARRRDAWEASSGTRWTPLPGFFPAYRG
ncbi:MAG TPA: GNAT family N-acetyltransferase [Anaeromyxobacter sp.]